MDGGRRRRTAPSSSASARSASYTARASACRPAAPSARICSPQPLPQRLLPDRPLQLRDQHGRVTARGQLGRRPLLHRVQPQRVEPGRLTRRERRVPYVGERRPPPEPERLPQQPGRAPGVARRAGPRTLPCERLEPQDVHVRDGVRDGQPVPGGRELHRHARRKDPAQP
ncbi:hypothetical protein STANM309S_03315 [Streptomyces tanashiensis]